MPKSPPPLSAKQTRFVLEYLVDLNATQAAIRSGYSKKTADVQGPRLLGNVRVAEAIAKGKNAVCEKSGITIARVIEEYKCIAFLDIAKAFDENGHLKPLHKMDESTRRAIASMEVEELFEGFGEDRERIGRLRKLRLIDKKAALDSLARHLGMFIERHEHTGKDGTPLRAVIQDV